MCILSVIIPAFNSAKYISSTLDSVLNQEMTNIEIIVVNDGSTDSTVSICEQYASRYSNVRIINQENQGVSVARNTGLDNAAGDYVYFLDADDYIASGAFSMSLQKELEKQQFDVFMFSSYGANVKRNRFGVHMKLSDRILPGRQIYPTAGCIGTCMYSRRLLFENDIWFDAGISRNEDQVFKMKALYMAKTIRSMGKFCYVYCTNFSSITHTTDKMIDCVHAWQSAFSWFENHISEEEKRWVLPYIQVKIQSRMLLYAQNYVQTGHGKNELLEEMQRIDALQLLKSVDENQVMPYQKEELRLFQQDLDKFIRHSRMEGWKISVGRMALKIPMVRNWRDRRKYPLEKI